MRSWRFALSCECRIISEPVHKPLGLMPGLELFACDTLHRFPEFAPLLFRGLLEIARALDVPNKPFLFTQLLKATNHLFDGFVTANLNPEHTHLTLLTDLCRAARRAGRFRSINDTQRAFRCKTFVTEIAVFDYAASKIRAEPCRANPIRTAKRARL